MKDESKVYEQLANQLCKDCGTPHIKFGGMVVCPKYKEMTLGPLHGTVNYTGWEEF